MKPHALCLLLAGCVTTQPVTVDGVRPADDSDISSCTYLDTVTGASGLYGVFIDQALTNARAAALRQAAAIGATHIVWVPAQQGTGSTQVSGKAYRCN